MDTPQKSRLGFDVALSDLVPATSGGKGVILTLEASLLDDEDARQTIRLPSMAKKQPIVRAPIPRSPLDPLLVRWDEGGQEVVRTASKSDGEPARSDQERVEATMAMILASGMVSVEEKG